MVSRGTVSNFWGFIKGLISSGIKSPFLTVIGNHDRHKPHGITNDKVYRATFGETNYVFDRGGRRFIVVDSSAGRITPEQLQWLASQLSPEIPTIVFTHIPPAPLGEWTDWGRLKGAGDSSRARRNSWRSCPRTRSSASTWATSTASAPLSATA
ncbi:MAG: metallophosphoesterase [Elusimicrobiota bacterium]|nr:MAG: metallophosphoesterase [Elusimicrobiota bacterium]